MTLAVARAPTRVSAARRTRRVAGRGVARASVDPGGDHVGLPPMRGGASVRNASVSRAKEVYVTEITRPMGLVLEPFKKAADPPLGAVVAEVTAGGHAAQGGKVQPGDVLVRCTAVELEAGDALLDIGDGHPMTKWRTVVVDVMDLPFDDVMLALRSNDVIDAGFVHHPVTLELARFADA